MKNWSFGKLIGVFAGSFVALILIAVVVIKAGSSPSASARRVAQTQAQTVQQPRMDVLSLELAKSREQTQAALQAQENSEKQLKIVRQESQQNTQLLLNQIKAMDTTLAGLEKRMQHYEQSRQHVEIVKPPRKSHLVAPAQGVASRAHSIPQSSGYKVQAVVGHRAWVKNGDSEDSIKAGDKLPPVQRELKVVAIDRDSGIVVTSPAR
ncbi:type IV secretion protein DotF [Pantoea sp. Tr-811]|uniref:type IV secretion protein DotF n=1 Tax=Pantoea sp. Tr-811 TaxID=2608361 RepID=UPI00141E58C9|nr:type IV secretion protein DotF [Pantoea sp. Tr-811]NIF27708.1 type IV secretion protein DotF [Pantoea sp. Tr-811]